MSVKIMSMVFERYPSGGGERLLALALADHAHDDGTRIFPSVARLALKSVQSERNVQRQLRRMEQIGWLIKVADIPNGRGYANEYRINPDWLKGDNLSPFSQDQKGDISDQKGDTRLSQKGDTRLSPQPSLTIIEPSVLPTSSEKQPKSICWNKEKNCFTNISNEQMEKWRIAFPGIDIDGTLDRIEIWFLRRTNASRTKRPPWIKIADGIEAWLQRDFNEQQKPKTFAKRQQQKVIA